MPKHIVDRLNKKLKNGRWNKAKKAANNFLFSDTVRDEINTLNDDGNNLLIYMMARVPVFNDQLIIKALEKGADPALASCEAIELALIHSRESVIQWICDSGKTYKLTKAQFQNASNEMKKILFSDERARRCLGCESLDWLKPKSLLEALDDEVEMEVKAHNGYKPILSVAHGSDHYTTLVNLHHQDRLALRTLVFWKDDVALYEDPAIVGDRRDCASYYSESEPRQIISCTLLPNATRPVVQRLFSTKDIFIGLRILDEEFKMLGYIDIATCDSIKNKKGRLTYGPSKDQFGVHHDSKKSTLKNLSKLNLMGCDVSARGMNELLLKVTTHTPVCLGVSASSLKDGPENIMELYKAQYHYFMELGVVLPMTIYNDLDNRDDFNKTIDKIVALPDGMASNSNMMLFLPRSIAVLENAISTLLEGTESKADMAECVNDVDYAQFELDRRSKYIEKLDAKLKTLSDLFAHFDTTIIQVHGLHSQSSLKRHYLEVNHDLLMHQDFTDVVNESRCNNVEDGCKLFHCYFRLLQYRKNVVKENEPINYANLNGDITMATALLNPERCLSSSPLAMWRHLGGIEIASSGTGEEGHFLHRHK